MYYNTGVSGKSQQEKFSIYPHWLKQPMRVIILTIYCMENIIKKKPTPLQLNQIVNDDGEAINYCPRPKK
jgi:hypothetical protein